MRILNPDERVNAVCHFCGRSQSVRYAAVTLVDGKPIEVKCCNRCVLATMSNSNMANVNDVMMEQEEAAMASNTIHPPNATPPGKLDNFDKSKLMEAKKIIMFVWSYYYGAPNYKSVTDRLGTIIKKLDYLIDGGPK